MRKTCILAMAAVLCLLAAPVGAHEEHRSNLEVVLDRVAPQPAGIEVRIVDTLAPQMLVTNRTGQTLEILDTHGAPVIRIGPDRTWVNASAPAYYSEHPVADRVDPATSTNPRWVVASKEASWGWFDPRIQVGDTEKPAKWHIDMRLGARPVVVSGRFRTRPVANGYWMPTIETPREVAPQVDVAIIPGVVPAVSVENRGQAPVTVIGARGEPFLRIGSDGVFANANSPTWMQSGRAPQTASPVSLSNDRTARWTKISPGERYTWLEWRARCSDDRRARTPMLWEIPLLVGSKSIAVKGETRWITIAPRTGDKSKLLSAAD
jgi:hypothetical protein